MSPLSEAEMQADLESLCVTALRAGASIERILAALAEQQQRLSQAGPFIKAALEAQRRPT